MTPRLALALLAASSAIGCASRGAMPDAAPPALRRPADLEPRRVGATAMEAWIAAWEDRTGDLYPPSTVYIAVDPERWEYAAEGGIRTPVLRPLQVERRPPPAAPAGPGPPAGPDSDENAAPPVVAPPDPDRRGA